MGVEESNRLWVLHEVPSLHDFANQCEVHRRVFEIDV